MVAALLGCTREDTAPGERLAPDFELSVLGGGSVSLASLRGRPVVIDFWATWCAPCIHQIPILNEFQAKHPDDAVLLGISVDTAGEDVVAAFAEEQQIAYRVLLGSPDVARRYGAIGFPSLYVIRPNGTVAFSHAGLVTIEDLEEAVLEAQQH